MSQPVSATTTGSDDPPLATPESLLGRLQRGRGAGFLGALRETPSAVWPLLMECITRDPRWDAQVEDRGYYADLVFRTRMDLAPLAEFLLTNDDPDQFSSVTWLTIRVLEGVARRGSEEAALILRDYVSFGRWWDQAVEALQNTPHSHLLDGLDVVICHRFPADSDLADELPFFRETDEPWKSWRQTNPRLAKALQEIEQKRAQARAAREIDPRAFAVLPLHQMLPLAGSREQRRIIEEKVQPADVELLAAHLTVQEPAVCAAAIRGLAKVGSPAAFAHLRAFLGSNPRLRPGVVRVAIVWAVPSFPAELNLGLGRVWFDDPDGMLRTIGGHILERHATAEDAPRLLAAVAESLEKEDMYRLCHALDAFQRLPDFGYLPELRKAYDEAPYARARMRAAKALSVTAPERFRSEVAFESLWDCEEETRALACNAADMTTPGVSERLSEIAADQLEEDTVRKAAAERLSGRAG
jgi:hypothetical protein